ncbi:tRNA (adenosine(37)-N6)-threonylcarbamoyltransferase complex transferase subunit TsaD [Bacteroidales bacterium OttesenSCG-928-K03]|nr:tRNA (adenosine(37)-N6)-threonylcarbamoyltransferase complex transferase subunit TsaD [Odoribacter sp. OttesenSCG-928-L07]MDL2242595.1 tRNA (adenosine(37)-N6)-threonylcarbamoyltransferase complex transferase subunit TsaD [Bacteroidales bacterium OttesenSCG-928-K03]
MSIYILGIESSCDDTSAAILKDTTVLANVTANQDVHRKYGGVVPELASRAHQQNIIPVIDQAFQQAKLDKKMISAIAFTRGPGLLGSLLVGVSFSKALAIGLNVPLIEVDHIKAHILAHFAQQKDNQKEVPEFPFLCLVVSGGHTQIVLVKDYNDMQIIGKTIDDAAGETFDKAAKIMDLGYPGGPLIDKLAKLGNPNAFKFAKPKIQAYDYSFSGLKTSFLYFLRDHLKEDPQFIEKNVNDLSASLQKTIIDILMEKLIKAAQDTGITSIAVAGGVSANSALRNAINELNNKFNWKVFIPEFEFTTDNAAMIATAGYFKYLSNDFTDQKAKPYSRGI